MFPGPIGTSPASGPYVATRRIPKAVVSRVLGALNDGRM